MEGLGTLTSSVKSFLQNVGLRGTGTDSPSQEFDSFLFFLELRNIAKLQGEMEFFFFFSNPISVTIVTVKHLRII